MTTPPRALELSLPSVDLSPIVRSAVVDDTVHAPAPAPPADVKGELSDDDLEHVVGGLARMMHGDA
jgi:hypothetical protein